MIRQRPYFFVFLTALTFSSAVATDENTAGSAPITGPQMTRALQQRRGFAAEAQTLRRALTELQQDTGICLVLDRRTDPSTDVTISTGYVSVRRTITLLAGCAEKTAASFGDRYVTVGPTEAAARLRTLTEINRQMVQDKRRDLSTDVYRALSDRYQLSWPAMAEPRQLVTNAAAKIGLTVTNPETIPHDLWAPAELPELSFGEFATLVLNQFDLTWQLTTDNSITVVPVPKDVVIEQKHRVPVREKEQIAQRWKDAFPQLKTEWKGSTATVRATVEVHEQLEALKDGKQTTEVAAAGIGARRFTMKVPAGTPMFRLIASLKDADIPIRFVGRTDAQLKELLNQPVEFDVTQMPAAEFFQTVFADWDADISVGDDEVVVTFPKP